MLYSEFEERIVSEIVNILSHYNSQKKYNIALSKKNTKDAIKDEAKNIDTAEYVPCLKAIYKKLSSIIYSHHCMARFHLESKTASSHLKALKDSENKEMHKYLIK